jgi:hypothetical protein
MNWQLVANIVTVLLLIGFDILQWMEIAASYRELEKR